MDLQARSIAGRHVVAEGGEEPHDVRGTAGDQVPLLPAIAAAAQELDVAVARERVHVEVPVTLQRDAGQHRVVERALADVGESRLDVGQQYDSAPHNTCT